MKIYIVERDLHYEGYENMSVHLSMEAAENQILLYVQEDLAECRRLYPENPSRWQADFYGISVWDVVE